jgi:hypothetical protein
MARPVTAAEQLALHIDRADSANHLTKVRCAWLLEGELDQAALARTLVELVTRHAILRSVYREVDGTMQCIAGACRLDELALADLRDVPEPARSLRLRELCNDLLAQTFEPATGPLVRAMLVACGAASHALVLVIHHVAFDGGSVRGLFDELRRGYRACAARDPEAALAAWSPPALQFGDFAGELARVLHAPAGQTQVAHWTRVLAGAPPLALPVDFARDPVDERRNRAPWGIAPAPVAEVTAAVPQAVRTAIATLARQERVTGFMVMLAGFASLLHRATDQDDLCFQSTYSLRNRPELERMLGYVGNPLVLRIDASGNPSFRELLRRARNAILVAWANGQVPVIDRAPHTLRRFNFNYLPVAHDAFATVGFADGLTATRLRVPSDASQVRSPFDVNLWLLDGAAGTQLRVVYLRELFRAATIDALLTGYVDLLARVAHAPDQRS